MSEDLLSVGTVLRDVRQEMEKSFWLNSVENWGIILEEIQQEMRIHFRRNSVEDVEWF